MLPLAITYRFSDLLYYINFYIIGYRKKVVLANLKLAFPEKSDKERIKIAKLFFRHFCDLIVESIRVFSISEKELLKRCKLRNPELIEAYYKQGKSIIIPAGHFNNWEYAATACDLQIPHQVIGIYKPLRNKFFNKVIQDSRSRFGMALLPFRRVKRGFMENKEQLTATLFGADQAPRSGTKVYWTKFMGIDTPVMLGSEKLAKEFDFPVVFGRIYKIKRGYYEFEFETLEDKPRDTALGQITAQHTQVLETEIRKNPQYLVMDTQTLETHSRRAT